LQVVSWLPKCGHGNTEIHIQDACANKAYASINTKIAPEAKPAPTVLSEVDRASLSPRWSGYAVALATTLRPDRELGTALVPVAFPMAGLLAGLMAVLIWWRIRWLGLWLG
jgi:hypothetical protein